MAIIELSEHRVMTQHRQSVWDVRRTFAHNARKMRVTIHNDPYPQQAYCRLELLGDDSAWHVVHTLPREEWYDDLDTLWISALREREMQEKINRVMLHMTRIGEDLLS